MTRLPSFLARALVAVSLVATMPTAIAANYVSVSRDQINMRTGPGTKFESKWMLSRGYPLQQIGRQGDWLKVRDFENDEGWVARSLTGKTPHYVVKSSTANIRSGPGTRHKRVGEAVYGEVLKTLERKADWVKVRQDGGVTGWVAQRLLWGW